MQSEFPTNVLRFEENRVDFNRMFVRSRWIKLDDKMKVKTFFCNPQRSIIKVNFAAILQYVVTQKGNID